MATKKDTATAPESVDLHELNRQMGLLQLSIEGLQAKAEHAQIDPEDIHPIWDLVQRIRGVTGKLPEMMEGVSHG